MGDWLGFPFSFNKERIVTFWQTVPGGKQKGVLSSGGGGGESGSGGTGSECTSCLKGCPLPALGIDTLTQ